ncbi:MAG: acyl carrier protein [Proteobacteria bacterium]|nr:acyl carrier protein [Pseudomonadota bacterium]MBU1688794.1 acyl carrier protein [Pseudomonadota bacterium]
MIHDEEIRRQVIEVIAEEFELDPVALTPEATLYDDLGLDSLDAVDMVVALEKKFGVKLANEESIRSVRTMADIFALIISLKPAGQ